MTLRHVLSDPLMIRLVLNGAAKKTVFVTTLTWQLQFTLSSLEKVFRIRDAILCQKSMPSACK